MTKLKVLALHGYGQNAHIFKTQIGPILRECADDIEFVIPDGPLLVHPPNQRSETLVDENGYPLPLPECAVNEETPRAWWLFDDQRTRYDHVDEGLAAIVAILRENHFDGIFGFSQGAVTASYVCAYLEDPLRHSLFFPPPHPPFKFAILASGLAPVDPPLPRRLQTPTLHVHGRHDTHFSPAEFATLVDVCTNTRIEVHPGAHFVGTKPTWRKFFHQWMNAFASGSTVRPEDIASPVPKVDTEPAPPADNLDVLEMDSSIDTPLPSPTGSRIMHLKLKWTIWTEEQNTLKAIDNI